MLLSAYLVSFTLLLGGELNGVLYRGRPWRPVVQDDSILPPLHAETRT